MSRFDKYDPRVGGFRAPLNMALTSTSGPSGVTDLGRILVVGLNGSGRVVKATSTVVPRGLIIANGPMAAGDITDVMTSGEIVELSDLDLQSGSPAAGTAYYHNNTAARLATTAPAAGAAGYLAGWTVEAGRLVVRFTPVSTPAA